MGEPSVTAKPYETFDTDLLEGKARQDAFARLLCTARFEHKRDYLAKDTGNIAVEFQTRKGDEIVASGISITTAEWWVVEYDDDCRLVVPTEHVKRLARLAIKANKSAWIGDGNNHRNALVPFHWFLKPPLSEVSA